MLSLFLRRTGVNNKLRSGLVMTRFYRKGCKSEEFNIREQTEGQHEGICLEKCPEVKNEKIRLNITDIHNVEKTRLPCERVRDISGKCINVFSCTNEGKENNEIPLDSDVRIESYNCSGLLNLSSSMQTSVPYPFQVKVKITHLNMPGGQWRQQAKYIAEQLQSFHYRSFSSKSGAAGDNQKQSEEPAEGNTILKVLKDLIAVIKEYGLMAINVYCVLIFTSLSTMYLLTFCGVDLREFLTNWGSSEGAETARTAGPFVVAYAAFWGLEPYRIALVLILTPSFVKLKRKFFIFGMK